MRLGMLCSGEEIHRQGKEAFVVVVVVETVGRWDGKEKKEVANF
jgi:hypothetical protein